MQISNSRTESASRVLRSKVLLDLEDDTKSNKEVSAKYGLSTVAISKLLDKCLAFGPIAALEDLPRSGKPATITDDDKAYVKHIACHNPKDFGYPEELWTQKKLADHIRKHCIEDGYPNLANINKSMVWKYLDQDGMKPHRIRYYLERRDPEFHKKMKEVLMVYKETQIAIETETDTGTITISYDEKPQHPSPGMHCG